MSMVYFDKAGTFTLHLNLITKEFSLDVVEIEEQSSTMTGGYIYSNKYGNKTLTANPETLMNYV